MSTKAAAWSWKNWKQPRGSPPFRFCSESSLRCEDTELEEGIEEDFTEGLERFGFNYAESLQGPLRKIDQVSRQSLSKVLGQSQQVQAHLGLDQLKDNTDDQDRESVVPGVYIIWIEESPS